MDLAVSDVTHAYSGPTTIRSVNSNVLVIGSDAVAVETVSATIVGLKSERMPIIQKAVKRELGEGDIKKIEIVEASFESVKEKFMNL